MAFIEVKIPNNRDGIKTEYNRINSRMKNKDFSTFINATQLMVFSNNQDYDSDVIEPLQGAFYGTTGFDKVFLNYFREEETLPILPKIGDKQEDFVLSDNNQQIIKYNAEFQSNKQESTPTNKILTSLFSKQRLGFLLRYGIAYIKDKEDNISAKHIMRYPQIFATKAIRNKLNEGAKKGIVWHTQGSGKTALSYYNVKYLTDYYTSKGKLPKFYFVVDRLDLANQASREFTMRGLKVHTINSRKDFAEEIKTSQTTHNNDGGLEITVVNIQKFNEDENVEQINVYDTDIQRVFFLDEVHRSYSNNGENLASLRQADKNAIHIGLTGTPLIGQDAKSRDLFGDYFHKYYYNASIADGYTLRIIREDIETTFEEKIKEQIATIEVEKGSIQLKDIFEQPKIVKEFLEYIVNDFSSHRARDDETIGGMVVCQSSEQARLLHKFFQERDTSGDLKTSPKTSALILHDEDTKSDRNIKVEKFKAGDIDLLFVYNMLLTGFDAPRLKKLYLTRVIKQHNLLQTLTRVNRPYKKFKYGYVVDFADISHEFDKTNRAYFEELNGEFGTEQDNNSKFFKSSDEIADELAYAKSILSDYDLSNKEEFRKQIDQISDKEILIPILNALISIKELYNTMRSHGLETLRQELGLDYHVMRDYKDLFKIVNGRNGILNVKASVSNTEQNFLQYAIEDIELNFTKVGEEELELADAYRFNMAKTREEFNRNIHPNDPEFISLKDELRRILEKFNEATMTTAELTTINQAVSSIYDKIKELNRKDSLLQRKYNGDAKFVRIFKDLTQSEKLNENGKAMLEKDKIHTMLLNIKTAIDEKLSLNDNLIKNDGVFNRGIQSETTNEFYTKSDNKMTPDVIKYITAIILKEYQESNI